MLFSLPQWLFMLACFAGSVAFFGRVYSTAVTWLMRARKQRQWETWAELAVLVASVPFALFFGFFGAEFVFFLARLGLFSWLSRQPLSELPVSKPWLALAIAVLHLIRTVPQIIAGAKVYVYSLEDKLRNEGQGS